MINRILMVQASRKNQIRIDFNIKRMDFKKRQALVGKALTMCENL